MLDCPTYSPVETLLRRAAQEIDDGDYVNLGIGLPSQVMPYIDPGIQPYIHAENGVLGAWRQAPREQMDPMLIDAGGSYVSTVPGCAFFDSATSFAMVRRGRLDMCMLGAFEVDAEGSLANWKIPEKFIPGIGGAMELAQSSRRLVVLSTHVDKHGNSKLRRRCTLPLTASRCVDRIITDKAVIDVDDQGLLVREMARGITAESLTAITEAPLRFVDNPGVY